MGEKARQLIADPSADSQERCRLCLLSDIKAGVREIRAKLLLF